MAVRKHIRLKNYDYRWTGFYFVTICIQHRLCLLGDVVDGAFISNPLGQIAYDCWYESLEHFPRVHLDAFCVMPNHVHGIVEIRAPYQEFQPRQFGKPQKQALSTMVGSYKSAVTRRINLMQNSPGESLWQPNYHEHIIRSERALENIRNYIQNNPQKWFEDKLHPDNPSDW